MAVIAAFELDGDVAAGEAAGDAQGAHGGCGAGVDQAHHLHGGHHGADGLGQFDFEFRGSAETGAAGQGFLNGVEDLRVAMADEQRAPGTDVIDVFVIVDIEEMRALAAGDEAGRAADAAPGAHRRIHAAGDGEPGAVEEFLRSFGFH